MISHMYTYTHTSHCNIAILCVILITMLRHNILYKDNRNNHSLYFYVPRSDSL